MIKGTIELLRVAGKSGIKKINITDEEMLDSIGIKLLTREAHRSGIDVIEMEDYEK